MLFGKSMVCDKGGHDWLAAGGLNRHHAWTTLVNPTQFCHLRKSLPHPDQSRSATGWINDYIRQFPVELFGDLIAERFFSFNSIRFFERRKIEPALSFFAQRDFSST